jgi:hypothetical protein
MSTTNQVNWGAAIEGASEPTTITSPGKGSSATDSSGNTYTYVNAINASSSLVIKNADGSTYATVTTSGDDTGVLVKRNISGAVQWYILHPSSGGLQTDACAVDSNGNVYIGGLFFGANTVTFQSTGGNPSKTVSKTDGDYGAYLAKYNSSGVAQWAIRPISYTESGSSGVFGLKTVGTDLYVLGVAPGNTSAVSSYSILNSDGSAFRSSISTTSPYQSTWLYKYNSSGNVQWATRCCEGNESRGLTIDIDSNGLIYVGGKLYATGSYTVYEVNGSSDQSTGVSIVATAGADGFLIQYSSAGARNWSAAVTGSSGETIWGSENVVALAASPTGIYVAMPTASSSINIKVNNTGSGTTISSLNTATASGLCFKLNSNGDFAWSFKSKPSDSNYAVFSSIVVDIYENVYVSGIFTSANLDVTDTNDTTTSFALKGSTTDSFVARFDLNGAYMGLNQITNTDMTAFWVEGPELSINTAEQDVYFVSGSYGTSSSTVEVYDQDGSTVGYTYTRGYTGYGTINVRIYHYIPTTADQAVLTITGLSEYIASFSPIAPNQVTPLNIDIRTAINNTSYPTTEDKTAIQGTYVTSMSSLLGTNSYTVASTSYSAFEATYTSVESGLTSKDILAQLPSYTLGTATVDVTLIADVAKYIHLEIPGTYTVTLQVGAESTLINNPNLGDQYVIGGFTFTVVAKGSLLLELSSNSGVVCILEGTEILTTKGYTPIENLRKGSKIITGDKRIAPIQNIYKITVAKSKPINAPYKIAKHAFGDSPTNDVYVSPRHAIQIKPDVWEIPCEAVKDNKKITQDKDLMGKQVIYYHFTLPSYETDTVVAKGGLVSECLNDGSVIESYGWNKAVGGYIRYLKPNPKAKTLTL